MRLAETVVERCRQDASPRSAEQGGNMSGVTYIVEGLAFKNSLWHKPEFGLLLKRETLAECVVGIQRLVDGPLSGEKRDVNDFRVLKLNVKGAVLATYPAAELLAGTLVETADLAA
jgi:hypothetical protein